MSVFRPLIVLHLLVTVAIADDVINFNRDVRPILSSRCLLCHGPDSEARQANLRLDQRDSAIRELDSGAHAVVPGRSVDSELIARVISDDQDLRMPPAGSGEELTHEQVNVLKRWIDQGAEYARHWSYEAPQRPNLPDTSGKLSAWPSNEIDHFVLHQMQQRGLQPSAAADRFALVRRVFLDLTGLPPTIAEADAFANDQDPSAYERLVDDLLQRNSFGEHWARRWLDMARYADSAGYADDPPRTIWAWRDWVIRAINRNLAVDQFTIEQLAGDLLPDPSEDQLIATAFHRNTMTNSEGGTIDEEWRNAAIVDRVNTTFSVWMGTTMACAQCHTHKYDPITQDEYFQVFAILNNTQDADRRDESPTVQVYSVEQRRQRRELEERIATLKQTLATPTPELQASQQTWEGELHEPGSWSDLIPASMKRNSGETAVVQPDGSVLTAAATAQDVYTVDIPLDAGTDIAAIQLRAIPHESLPQNGPGLSGGNFVITGVQAELVPHIRRPQQARYVRITNISNSQFLSLAEVEVFQGATNVAGQGIASQSSTDFGGPANYAIDGNTDGDYTKKSTTHTSQEKNPWWELDLRSVQTIDSVKIWNRTDNNLQTRLSTFRIDLLDADRNVVWQETFDQPPNPSQKAATDSVRSIRFVTAFADYHQNQFEPQEVLARTTGKEDGWAIGGQTNRPHELVLVPDSKVEIPEPLTLRFVIEQKSPHVNHLLGHFRIAITADDRTVRRSQLPRELAQIVDQSVEQRTSASAAKLAEYYRRHLAPELAEERSLLTQAVADLSKIVPMTSVPVLRENTDDRRTTRLQYRGNWQSRGHEVTEGVPAAFHPMPAEGRPNRLTLAQWLVDAENPLTARVLVNRYWEALFGQGLVKTSEDFGSQGALPTHPRLLDWLATEFVRLGWDRKAILKTIVMSSTYRQSARVDAAQFAVDPDNRWLARGPRVRLSAEMVRDQALFVSGLLSSKMYGKPVNPPQPRLGLSAAFGSSTDWKTSEGEDRYRRGIYTTWRRSNPYPSMATFDAPNREFCTVRRNSTNTPLQSLVTLNDPVYVEAAQALARAALQQQASSEGQMALAFRRCLLRLPSASELNALMELFLDSRERLAGNGEETKNLATEPLGMLPDGIDETDAAAMTVVCNVLLNLDEMFLKR